MEEYKNTNLIVAENGHVYQVDTVSEMVKSLFGNKYIQLTPKEQLKHRFKVAYPRALFNKMVVAISNKGIVSADYTIESQEFDFSNAILIDNDITLLLGLAKINDIQIFEKLNSNIFQQYLGKTFNGEYVNIGKFAGEILDNYLSSKKSLDSER